MNPSDNSNRWALVTGASAGIGTAFAHVFARHGFNVVLTARRKERLEQLAAELERDHGVSTICVPADLADIEAPQQIFRACAASNVRISALVNNAGFSEQDFLSGSWTDHAAFLQVLTTAVVQLTHLFAGPMVEQGWGRVINVSSLAGLMPGAGGRMLYTAAKSFLVKFSEGFTSSFGDRDVRACALCPGFTYTEFHDVDGSRDSLRGLPEFMWMSAADVAEAGFEAVMSGEVLLVPGAPNKAASALAKFLPGSTARLIIKRFGL